MKKFLVMFAIAGALVACNNEGENKSTIDSTSTITTTQDTLTTAPVVVDTTVHVADPVKTVVVDSTRK